jgi:hypothetical protein
MDRKGKKAEEPDSEPTVSVDELAVRLLSVSQREAIDRIVINEYGIDIHLSWPRVRKLRKVLLIALGAAAVSWEVPHRVTAFSLNRETSSKHSACEKRPGGIEGSG